MIEVITDASMIRRRRYCMQRHLMRHYSKTIGQGHCLR